MPYFEPSWDVLSKTTKIVPNALTYKLQHLDLETSTLDRGIEADNCILKGTIIHALKDKSGPVLNSSVVASSLDYLQRWKQPQPTFCPIRLYFAYPQNQGFSQGAGGYWAQISL